MTIAWVNGNTAGDAVGGDITLTKPTGTVDNDFLVTSLYSELSSAAWTLPAGWAWWSPGGTGQRDWYSSMWQYTAWKRAASEGASYIFTHGGSAYRVGAIGAWRGVYASGDPEDSDGPTGYQTNSTTIKAQSITTNTANAQLIVAAGNFFGTALTAGTSGMTVGIQLGGTGLAYVNQAAAGASGIKSFNAIVDFNWATWHMAVKEAATLSLEQEGFRFRNDDGSESTATWLASQDANIQQPVGINTRLRFLVNVTGDPASQRYKLRYRKVGDDGWRDLKT